MNLNCHICNTKSEFLLSKDDFDLYKCPSCKLVFVHPQPTIEFLEKELYSYESGYQANNVGDLSHKPESIRARRALDYFEKIKQKGSILDVGCAHGQFLYWAKKRGFDVVGVELNKRTADSAQKQGFEVYNCSFADIPIKVNYFDFIFLGEIIEHVPSPREFIKKTYKFSKPEGIVVITTPNLNCFWSRATLKLYYFFGIPWSSVTPPHHLFQFSDNNLDILLGQEGFKLVNKSFITLTRLKYELGMLHLLKRLKKSKKIKDFIFMLFAFSTYILVYSTNIMLSPFLEKDFNMIKFYKKIGVTDEKIEKSSS